MFEKATRINLKFKSKIGILIVQDLWILQLEELDAIAKDLYRSIKEEGEISFIEEASSKSQLNELRLDIVKHIIACKLQEKKDAVDARDKADRKQTILGLLREKQVEGLKSKSEEELLKELEEL